ncbi:hypothetical protein [Arthrobacter sp. NIO-1057]|uniref:hypothetical protein n=1 Tax=Arthrobacter sp. NIO-1057 TaxID=993071 RepID=UPI00071CAB06|nr:hypothetical protein [Arthrobacter sp. NIO-1057]KSU66519.1 hypothetical protein AS038_07545 [Arthrobacter sp. NIO-1057]SCC16554.1 hypothetical protein GA0061084_1529 [Arthrobacter sp. NIO-1057]
MPAALLATLSLWLGGCSADDGQVSADALHQEHELAFIRTEVTQPNQELSLGFPLNGGQYSLAMQCSGEERSSTIEWNTSDSSDHGEINVPCSSDGNVVHQEISLGGYSRLLSFDVSGLQGQLLQVSVAGFTGP